MFEPNALLEEAERIYRRVLDVSAQSRSDEIAAACGTDEPLKRLVTRLLSVDDSVLEGFLEPARTPITDATWHSEEAGRRDRSVLLPPELSGTIGHYEILGRIGRGGGGSVYAARDLELERRVALKVIAAPASGDEAAVRRITHEARLLASLNHPNVATVHAREEIGGVPFIVQELIDGETLRDRLAAIEERRAPTREARAPAEEPRAPVEAPRARGSVRAHLGFRRRLEIVRDVAEAVAAAHEIGLVHRDLKPANVMLTSRGRVKVLDFGIARATNDGSGADRAGTPGYMSPEQLRGERPQPEHDVWSFGCLLFEMVTGSRAIAGDGALETMRATLDGEVDWENFPLDVPETVRTLAEQCLSLEPGRRPTAPTIVAALEHVLENVPSTDDPPPDATRTNLPERRDPFVGREPQIADVLQRQERSRLVTIVGMPGVGKTRLALEVVYRSLDRFDDGVWFSRLVDVTGPRGLAGAVARALGVRDEGSRSVEDRLSEHLADRRLLLVLDNCEQIVSHCRMLCDRLLAAAPGLEIVATSRVPLGAAEESICAIPTMELPDVGDAVSPSRIAANEAVRLFVERAVRANAAFRLDADTAGSIARLVRHLEGIPLAIELAAAQTRVLSPIEILERLDERLSLAPGSDARTSHRDSLRSALDEAHALITEDERELLDQLTVFRGGWTLAAVDSVCVMPAGSRDAVELLASLADKSWIVRQADEDGEARHDMLRVVRDYVIEKRLDAAGMGAGMGANANADANAGASASADANTVAGVGSSRAHARHFAFVETVVGAPRQRGDGAEAKRIARATRELDNVRGALDDPDRSIASSRRLRLIARMGGVWYSTGLWTEGMARCEAAVASLAGDAEDLAAVHDWIGQFALGRGDLDAATRAFEASLEISRSRGAESEVAQTLRYLGHVEERRGRYHAAESLYHEAVDAFERLDDAEGLAGALAGVAGVASLREDHETAHEYYERALAETRRCGFTAGEAMLLGSLAGIAYHRGDYATALDYFGDALHLNEEAGNRRGWAAASMNCGASLLALGRADDAAPLVHDALAAIREMDDRVYAIDGLAVYAALETALSEHREAAEAVGTVLELRKKMRIVAPAASKRELDELLATLREALGEHELRRHLRRGARRDWKSLGSSVKRGRSSG